MMAVYFLNAPTAGVIKIGLSNCVERRFTATVHWSPVPLKILGVYEGGDALCEAFVQWRFREVRSHADWYFNNGELYKFLKTWSGGPIPGAYCFPQYMKTQSGYSCYGAGCKFGDIERKFGLGVKDVLNILGLKYNTAYSRNTSISIKHIPALMSHFSSSGSSAAISDFLSIPLPERTPTEARP